MDSSFDDYGAAAGPAGPARAVVGDARALPFEDGSFDVVVAVDLLEHVPAADRRLVVDELARAAARRVVLACPAGPAALEADRALAARLARAPPWLDEHLANGFPDPDEVRGWLEPRGRLQVRGNEHVRQPRRGSCGRS